MGTTRIRCAAVAIVAAATLLTGCGGDSGSNDASDAATADDATQSAEGAEEAEEVDAPESIDTAALCGGIDEGAVKSVLGSEIHHRDSTKPGDPLPFGNEKSEAYTCTFGNDKDLSSPTYVAVTVGYNPKSGPDVAQRISEVDPVAKAGKCVASPVPGLGEDVAGQQLCQGTDDNAQYVSGGLRMGVQVGASGGYYCYVATRPKKPHPAPQDAMVAFCLDTLAALSG